jgi:hypothetical protein
MRSSISISGIEIGALLFQSLDASGLFGHGKNHGLECLYIIVELCLGSRHGYDQNIFRRDPPVVLGT